MTTNRIITRLRKLICERGYLIGKRAELIRARKCAAHVEIKLRGVTTKILQAERKLERVA